MGDCYQRAAGRNARGQVLERIITDELRDFEESDKEVEDLLQLIWTATLYLIFKGILSELFPSLTQSEYDHLESMLK